MELLNMANIKFINELQSIICELSQSLFTCKNKLAEVVVTCETLTEELKKQTMLSDTYKSLLVESTDKNAKLKQKHKKHKKSIETQTNITKSDYDYTYNQVHNNDSILHEDSNIKPSTIYDATKKVTLNNYFSMLELTKPSDSDQDVTTKYVNIKIEPVVEHEDQVVIEVIDDDEQVVIDDEEQVIEVIEDEEQVIEVIDEEEQVIDDEEQVEEVIDNKEQVIDVIDDEELVEEVIEDEELVEEVIEEDEQVIEEEEQVEEVIEEEEQVIEEEEQVEEEVIEEEEEEQLDVVTINGIDYCTSDEMNGDIYSYDGEDIGPVVGKYTNGIPTIFKVKKINKKR